jgi:putative SOS response-associated peptidase YedK
MLTAAAQAHVPAICINPDVTMIRDGELVPAPGTIARIYESLRGPVEYVGKPYSAIFNHAVTTAAVGPGARVVMIGDSPEHDVAGAKAMGLSTLLVQTGIHHHLPEQKLLRFCDTKKRAEKLQAKGKTVDFKELLRMEPDGGMTNIRNVKSKHWTRWLGAENRCVVPFNSFSEFNKAEGDDIWFALDEGRPLACFAGIWTNWTSVRKVKEGETTNDLYAFLTTEPNAEVGAIHPKAMPVILTTPEEVEAWMTTPPDEALKLQRPLPDGALRIVARGVKEDLGRQDA